MIVLDTSALMAVVLNEAPADAVAAALETNSTLTISAATLAEALIVARRRGVGEAMADLIEGLGIEVAPVTRVTATAIADAYDRWGKGVNDAGLNFGDCFAYELAKTSAGRLLYVGDDFKQTDIESALALG